MPRAEFYTKEEIDERIAPILDQLETMIGAVEFLGLQTKRGFIFGTSHKDGWRGVIRDLRRRFLL